MKIKIFFLILIFLALNFFNLKNFFDTFYALNIEKNENKKIEFLDKQNSLESKLNLSKIYLDKKNLEKFEKKFSKINEKIKEKNFFAILLQARFYYIKGENIKITHPLPPSLKLREEEGSNILEKIKFYKKSLEFYRKALEKNYNLKIEKNILFIEKKIKSLEEKLKKMEKKKKNSGKNKNNEKKKTNQNNNDNKEEKKKIKNFLKKYSKKLENNQKKYKKFYNKNYDKENKNLEEILENNDIKEKKYW